MSKQTRTTKQTAESVSTTKAPFGAAGQDLAEPVSASAKRETLRKFRGGVDGKSDEQVHALWASIPGPDRRAMLAGYASAAAVREAEEKSAE